MGERLMETTVRDTLCALIRRYGQGLSADPARCRGMLNDLLRGQHRREVFVLINALQAGIAADLLRGGGLPAPLLLGRLRARLEDELALTGEAAHWAVETWALALGVIDTPVPVQPAAPQTEARGRTPPAAARRPFEPEMVDIRAGRFLMGSPSDEPGRLDREGPQHWVQVPAFALGRYALTFEEWDACVAAGGCTHTPTDQGWGRGRRPVVNVSWNDARRYVGWLSRTTGKDYRLPSEAEWEYACRAGTTTPFSTGRSIHTDQANYDGNFDDGRGGARTGVYLLQTRPVGSYPPNPWGLHDMHGNVWEWTEDCWNGGYTGAPTDGCAWQTGDCPGRVVRGGSWYDNPRYLRCAARDRFDSGERGGSLGFRVARS